MPDRDYEKRDELLDKGWQKMSGILDKEMPQGKSRRRLFLWIPIGMLGFLAMSYSVWNLVASDSKENEQLEESITPKSPSESIKEIESAEVSNAIMADAENSVKRDEPSRTSMRTDEAGSRAIRNETVASQAVSVTTEPGSKQGESSVAAAVKSNNYNDNKLVVSGLNEVASSKEIDKIASVNSDLSVVGDEVAEVPELPQQHETVPSVSFIGSVGPSAIYQDSRVSMDPILPAVSKVKGAFGLDAYISTHWNTPIQLEGVEGGLLAAWEASPRFTVTGGVAYGHHRKLGIADLSPRSKNDAELANVNDPLDTTSFGGGNVQYDLNRVGYDTAEYLVNKLNYLHIPLYVEYRATRNLSVRLGARASYMLGAPVSQRGQVFVANPAFPGTQVLDANSSVLLLKEGVLKRWDIAPTIGVGWDISRLLAIDVNYQHGLIPYIDRDAFDRSDYNRTLSVGLRVKML